MEKITKERHIALLKKTKEFLNMRDLRHCTKVLSTIIDKIESNYKGDYFQLFQNFKDAYHTDIVNKGKFQFDSYVTINKIFLDAIKKPIKPLLKDTFPLTDDWLITRKNLERFEKLRDREKFEDTQFFLSCFIYLMEFEGSYKSWIRILFYLLLKTLDEKVTLSEVNSKSLSTIKDMMIKRKVNPIIFEGFKNGEIRAGIAHAHLFYNDVEKKMKFQDRKNGNITWEDQYSFKEFYDLTFKMAIIADLCYEQILERTVYTVCYYSQELV